MPLLDDLRDKMGKKKVPTLKSIVKKATGCSYRHIHIPDRHMDLVSVEDAKEFLAKDTIDKRVYVTETFDCDDFARNVYNNARNYGLRIKKMNWCWAEIWIRGHALNLYVTQDFKVIFIEPQTDKETMIHAKTIWVKF